MTKKYLDLHLGFKNEDNLFNTLKLYFDEPDLKKTIKYALTDFYSKSKLIELKTRRCEYNSFATTIVGLNKCKHYQNQKNMCCYFVFNFLKDNTIFYIKYDKELFDTFEIENTYIYRDNKQEPKINIHIPIKYLKEIIV